jgi:hypothetical protein
MTSVTGRCVSGVSALCILPNSAGRSSPHLLEYDGTTALTPSILSSPVHKAYDYAGSWLTFVCQWLLRSCRIPLMVLWQADNQANLYGGSRTGVSTDEAVKHYVAGGATSRKITMGKTSGFRKNTQIQT